MDEIDLNLIEYEESHSNVKPIYFDLLQFKVFQIFVNTFIFIFYRLKVKNT